MKAAVLYQTNKPLEIEELEIPKLRTGQILVNLTYSGVCHSQLMEARGFRGEDKYLPHLMGHEGVGEVVDIGPEVRKVKIGDRVVLGWIKGEGLDAGGTQYKSKSGKTINSGAVTTFSDMAVVSENRVIPHRKEISDQVAVLFGCAVPTGVGLILNQLTPESKKSIAVFGLGGIGLSALMATRLYDFSKVIAVDISPEKLELAKKFGATHVINTQDVDPLAMIRDLTEGRGVDYAVEASGLASVIEMAFSALHLKHGKLIFASHPKQGDKISLDPFELICGKSIRGSWGGGCRPDQDLPRFFDLYQKGDLPLDLLLSDPYRLEDVNLALDDLDQKKITRAIMKVSE